MNVAPTSAPTTGLKVLVRTAHTATSSKAVGSRTKTAMRKICWMLLGPVRKGAERVGAGMEQCADGAEERLGVRVGLTRGFNLSINMQIQRSPENAYLSRVWINSERPIR
jgi:hypothetical protein